MPNAFPIPTRRSISCPSFFPELERITAADGAVVFSFSGGADTPIYVPPEVLRTELSKRGFSEFADFVVGNGTALAARKPPGGVV